MGKMMHKKIDIACEYLDMAMRLYMEEQNYFCAIHLAAAATELLGAHLPVKERIFTKAWKAQKALVFIETKSETKDDAAKKVMNWSMNAIKHMGKNGDSEININPLLEAEHWIELALINFDKLNLPKSPTMFRYGDCWCNHKEE